MSSPDITFGAGDRFPAIADTLVGPDGQTPIDLTGRTVTFRYRVKNQTAAEVDQGATVTGDPTLGNVQWSPSIPAVAGNYNANWIVDLGLSTQITIPNDRYLWMKVLPAP